MPIGRTLQVLAFVLAMGALPMAGHAQSRQLITSIAQLENDKDVRTYHDIYISLSGANMIYAQCAAQLNISAADQDYLKQKFSTVSQAYVQAYQDAYVAAVGALPPQSFLNDVVQALVKRQQDAVNQVNLLLQQKKGCYDARLRSTTKYVSKLQQQDLTQQNTTPAVPAEPYH